MKKNNRQDYRRETKELIEKNNLSVHKIATSLGVHLNTARNWMKGKRYYVYWYQDGKKKCQRAGFKWKAADDLRKTIDGRAIGREAGIPDESKTVNELIEEYKTQSKLTKKPNTIIKINYSLKFLQTLYGYKRLLLVTRQDIEKLRNSLLTDKHTPNGVNIILNPISACMGYAVAHGYIKVNPARGLMLAPVKVAKFLTPDEIKALFEALQFNPQLKDIIKIALFTGMRQGEILGIQKEKIRDGMIYIGDTKTGAPRIVPIHREIKVIMESPEFLKEWNKNRIERAFRRAVARARLGRVRFHDLRHTFASTWLQNGGNIADLKEIGGWKSLQALQCYTHFTTTHLKDRINSLNYA